MALRSSIASVDAAATEFSRTILSKLMYSCGKTQDMACDHDWYMATALAVRDHVVDHWIELATCEREGWQ